MGCGWGHPEQQNRSRNRERLSFTLKATAEELTRPEGKSLQRHDGLSNGAFPGCGQPWEQA